MPDDLRQICCVSLAVFDEANVFPSAPVILGQSFLGPVIFGASHFWGQPFWQDGLAAGFDEILTGL